MDEKYWTVREIAEQLKVSRQAVYNWLTEGRLRYIKAGKAVRIPASALAEFLQPGKPGERIEEDERPGQWVPALVAA